MKKSYLTLTIMVGIIFLTFTITVFLRPSFRDFQHYAEQPNSDEQKIILRQTDSYLFHNIFAKDYYEGSNEDGWRLTKTIWYKGEFNNFYEIK